MTREEAISILQDEAYFLYEDDVPYNRQAFDMAIKALSQEPCDDAISRILKRMWNCRGKHTTSIDKVKMEQIIRDELHSVTQKSGKWLLKRTFPTKLYDEYLNEYQCSECYRGIRCTESQLVNYPYCHCGAKMESEDRE